MKTHKYIIRTFVTICCLLSTNATVLYVDKTTGSDSNSGTIDSPLGTIRYAIDQITEDSSIIYVNPGTYIEGVEEDILNGFSITQGISIIGTGAKPEDVIITGLTNRRAVYINHPDALIQNVKIADSFYNCTEDYECKLGGNVFIDTLGGTIENCVISNGRTRFAYNCGGGNIYIKAGLVSRCIIEKGFCYPDTSSKREGGANVYMDGGIVEYCLIKEGKGGSVVRLNKAGTLRNCTIVNNTASGQSTPQDYASRHGVVRAEQNARVINCIIYNNNTDQISIPNSSVWGGDATCFINNATDGALPISESNYSITPNTFVDESNADYRITICSEAYNHGLLEDYMYTGLDLDGNPRISNNTPDIGCYELMINGKAIDFYANTSNELILKSVTFTATNTENEETRYSWDFGDGSTATGQTVTHSYTTSGNYTISVSALLDGELYTSTKTNYMSIVFKDIYVDINNASPAPPYSTKETAANSISEALEYANDKMNIIVAEGLYNITSEITIDKSIKILSETQNPASTILDCGQKNRHFTLNHAESVISGFTLQNGQTTAQGGSILIDSYGGTISNCVFRNNRAYDKNSPGAPAISAKSPNALITHIKAYDNTIQRYDRRECGAIEIYNGGIIKDSLIADTQVTEGTSRTSKFNCGGIYLANGQAINCSVINCSGKNFFGIIALSPSSVKNCQVAGCMTTINPTTSTTETKSTSYYTVNSSALDHCASDIEADSSTYSNNFVYASLDQMFVDFDNKNYNHKINSPLINAGIDYNLSSRTVDNKIRVADGKIDIGCFESDSRATIIILM